LLHCRVLPLSGPKATLEMEAAKSSETLVYIHHSTQDNSENHKIHLHCWEKSQVLHHGHRPEPDASHIIPIPTYLFFFFGPSQWCIPKQSWKAMAIKYLLVWNNSFCLQTHEIYIPHSK
jgi:hypothetical protein